MKRLGYPLFLVLVSLTTVVCFTTITAVTLASYSKTEKNTDVIKEQPVSDESTVAR